jgi:hypothetical protein
VLLDKSAQSPTRSKEDASNGGRFEPKEDRDLVQLQSVAVVENDDRPVSKHEMLDGDSQVEIRARRVLSDKPRNEALQPLAPAVALKALIYCDAREPRRYRLGPSQLF